MMHHTKFFKRCLTQPRLLLRTFLLGMLLTGCFAVMAGIGVSMAFAQSFTGQDKPHHKLTHEKPKHHEAAPTETPAPTGTPVSTVTPTPTEKVTPVNNNQNTGAANNAAGSNNTSGAPGVGGVPVVGGIPVAPGGVGSRPGLPFTGSDPGNNPLP